MNEQMIEQLLRKAPAPQAPANLKDDLIAGIRLRPTSTCETEPMASHGWFQRWFPALSVGACAVACLSVLGAQCFQLVELRRVNDELRASAGDLPALREANKDAKRLRDETAELAGLRAQDAELRRLRDEADRLRAEADGLPQLREENRNLAAAISAATAGKPDYFAKLQTHVERIRCVNNLKQIGLAMRIWANDNNDKEPPDLISMTNALVTWNILHCPSDKSREINSWADVAAGNVSYKISTEGLTTADNPNIVVGECPLHHNILMLDGSVQQLSEAAMTKRIVTDTNGHRVFVPSGQ